MKYLPILILLVSISGYSQIKRTPFTKWELYKNSKKISYGSSGDALPAEVNLASTQKMEDLIIKITNPHLEGRNVNWKLHCFCVDSPDLVKTIMLNDNDTSEIRIKKSWLKKLRRKCANKKVAITFGNNSVSTAFFILFHFSD